MDITQPPLVGHVEHSSALDYLPCGAELSPSLCARRSKQFVWPGDVLVVIPLVTMDYYSYGAYAKTE